MNAALALEATRRMTVDSELLGALAIQEDEIIRFEGGLFGFPDCRSFVLIPAERDGMFWLQSTEHSTLAFLLADPFLFFDGYSVELGAGDRAELRASGPAEVAILAIVTLPRTRDTVPTANLQGPLAFNLAARVGKQIAVADTDFGLRCPLRLA